MISASSNANLESRALDDLSTFMNLPTNQEDWCRYRREEERTVSRFLMYNFGKHSIIGTIKHYTRKTTLDAMIDYVKTYFK